MNVIKSSNVNIKWQHVAAHSGIAGNEEADRLALRAAKGENTAMNSPEQKEDNTTVISTNKNQQEDTTLPRIIVIPRENSDSDIPSKRLIVINIPTTPTRKTTKDRSETPVPGSINGSTSNVKEKVEMKGSKKKDEQLSSKGDSLEANQTVKIMKNFESTLQNMMLEVHQLKQHQIDFATDIKDQLNNLQSRQLDMHKAISDVSNNLGSSLDKCYNRIEDIAKIKKGDKTIDSIYSIMPDMIGLQKQVDSNNETIKSSIKTMDGSVTTLKIGLEKMSKDCQTEFNELESKNVILQELVTEANEDIRASKEIIKDIEKSLTAITQQEEFIKPIKSAKQTVPNEMRSVTPTANIYASLIEDDDEEVTFRNNESNTQLPIIITEESQDKPKSSERENVQKTTEAVENNEGSKTTGEGKIDIQPSNGEQETDERKGAAREREMGRRTLDTRRDKIYLIGDSISGQVNHVALGKSTKTFVKKKNKSTQSPRHKQNYPPGGGC